MRWTVLLCLFVACRPQDDGGFIHYDDTDSSLDSAADSAAESDPFEPATDCEGPCPCDMVPVGDPAAPTYCIDAYEDSIWPGADGDLLGDADQGLDYPNGSTSARAWSVAGVVPTINVSWYQAYAACENAGKHLCSPAEWEDACDGVIGDGGSVYAWGDKPAADEVYASAHPDGTSDYDALAATGAFPECRTPSGVYDLAGNAWEWVDPGARGYANLPLTGKVGGAYYAGEGSTHCGDAPNGEHPPEFDGTIGVRCCAPPLSAAREAGGG